MSKVESHQEKMRYWANHSPSNYLHKWYLVEAERCRVLGEKAKAIEYYDCAILHAKTNKYLQEEALACELAAKFYLEWEKIPIAQTYILDAYRAYQYWGATSKVKHLEKTFSHLLKTKIGQGIAIFDGENTLLTASTSTTSLDLTSILKASQTLAQEIKLDALVAKMMAIIIENAGAQKGHLILQLNGEWKIVASGELNQVKLNIENAISLSMDAISVPTLPHAIVNYVIRTGQHVVLHDALNGKFTKDAYIRAQQPKSVICFPLLNQGKLVGILYLENNLVKGAFTTESLKTIQLLSSQAAISIENATLYNTLELKAQERTNELLQALTQLKQTQTQLVQSEKMSALGQMVAGIAHEINNPANFIYGNITHVNNYTQDLLELIQAYQKFCPNPPQAIDELLEKLDIDFLADDLSKILQSMTVGTQRIYEIVLSLRNFSRLDEAELKAANIHEGIDNTLMLLQHRLQKKPDRPCIQIIKEYANIPQIECYAAQLNQVFLNILANAIDALEDSFIADKSKTLTVLIQTQMINNTIQISIADNGIGIPQNVISKIFDPFFTTKPVGKGIGMGLSTSYQTVVGKHHGKLWCNSAPFKGTKFVIEIPVNNNHTQYCSVKEKRGY